MHQPKVSVVIPTHNRKAKVIRLIESVINSNYPKDNTEIIVVDACSADGTFEELKKTFPFIKAVRSDQELWPSESRNVGLRASSGDLILFIDDDNILNPDALKHLVECMVSNQEVGVCAPLMLYSDSDEIWCAGIKRNMMTTLTTFLHHGEKMGDGMLPALIESDDFPNCFMVRTSTLVKEKITFDEKRFPINFEESDFIFKIKKLGFKVVCVTKAVDWHDARRSSQTGLESERRTYFLARNRIVFHRKYSRIWEFVIYLIAFNWLITSYYLWTISSKLAGGRFSILKGYLKGLFDGIRVVVTKSV